MRLVVISGHSGSGKTSALNILEDAGFACIDNLPASLLQNLISQLGKGTSQKEKKLAVGIDARNLLGDLSTIAQILKKIRAEGVQVDVIFMYARRPDLVRRYSETRRKHPLSSNGVSLMEAIELEDSLLAPIAKITNQKVDTTGLSQNQLRGLIKKIVEPDNVNDMAILFESFTKEVCLKTLILSSTFVAFQTPTGKRSFVIEQVWNRPSFDFWKHMLRFPQCSPT